MATTYSNQIPLDQLKSGDSVLFGDKINWQSPDVQKLIGQGSANWNYDASNNPIGINVTKPYIAPTTQYTPEALNNLYGQVANAYKGIDTTQYQDLLKTQQQALLGKQAELGKYDIGTQQAVYGLEGQGRGITSGLVAGQQEKLQRQRSLQRLGMAQDVENLQNQYQMAQSNVANIINTQKYNQELEQQKLNSLIGIAEKIKADETATQEKKAKAEQAVANEEKKMILDGYTKLKPSQLKNYTEADIIRMPNGDIWSKPSSSKHSTSYIEWQDYKASGGKLNFNDYMTMDANRKRSVTNISIPKNYTGLTIPNNVKTDLLADVKAGNKIEDVMAAYPEVDTAYIQSLYPKSGITNPFE